MNTNHRKIHADPEVEAPIELAPGQDDEPSAYGSTSQARKKGPEPDPNHETSMDEPPPVPPSTPGESFSNGTAEQLSDVLRWALDSMQEPAMTAADWLARDIDPKHPTASALLANPQVSMAQVRQAKTVYKTMRIVGEKSADRRVGARMYAAAIAAGLVRHGRLVSTQSQAALTRAFQALLDDRHMPKPLRELGGLGLCALKDMSAKGQITFGMRKTHKPTPKSGPDA